MKCEREREVANGEIQASENWSNPRATVLCNNNKKGQRSLAGNVDSISEDTVTKLQGERDPQFSHDTNTHFYPSITRWLRRERYRYTEKNFSQSEKPKKKY